MHDWINSENLSSRSDLKAPHEQNTSCRTWWVLWPHSLHIMRDCWLETYTLRPSFTDIARLLENVIENDVVTKRHVTLKWGRFLGFVCLNILNDPWHFCWRQCLFLFVRRIMWMFRISSFWWATNPNTPTWNVSERPASPRLSSKTLFQTFLELFLFFYFSTVRRNKVIKWCVESETTHFTVWRC